MHINLLPERIRLRLLVQRRLRQWVYVWWMCGAVALAPSALRYRQVQHREAAVRESSRKCSPLRGLEQETVRLERQKQEADAEAERLAALAGHHPWRLLKIVADSARLTEGRLQLQRFDFQAKSASPAPQSGHSTAAAPAASLVGAPSSVILRGVCNDDLAIARFVAGLRGAGFFEQVVLKSSQELRAAEQTLRLYEIECSY